MANNTKNNEIEVEVINSVCPKCAGRTVVPKGLLKSKPCPVCKSSGEVLVERPVEVNGFKVKNLAPKKEKTPAQSVIEVV